MSKQYSRDEIYEVLAQVELGGDSVKAVADRYGLAPSTIYRWRDLESSKVLTYESEIDHAYELLTKKFKADWSFIHLGKGEYPPYVQGAKNAAYFQMKSGDWYYKEFKDEVVRAIFNFDR